MPDPTAFTDEASFLDHYARARHIARDPRNHVRTFEGDDLLGVAFSGPGGGVFVDQNGHVVWQRSPIAGWVPEADGWEDRAPSAQAQEHHVNTRLYAPPPGPWRAVPVLAPHLQSTIVVPDGSGVPRIACRVTPEVRLERIEDNPEPQAIRVLSFEWRILGRINVTNPMVNDLLDQQAPLIRMWYPLAEKVTRSAHTIGSAGGIDVTNLLIRLRALHAYGAAL